MSNHLHAETLWLEGPDAKAFAHAQFSSKADSLVTGRWQFSAWLDPQGRVRAFFHLARLDDERYLLMLRGGDAVTLATALQRLVFRSRVKLTAMASRVLATAPAIPMHEIRQEHDELWLGCDNHSLKISANGMADEAWRLPQLQAGWPWLMPTMLGEFLPAALSLQRLDAVAVDKGCYPGQEIVARLHFRGGHKRHLHRGRLSQAAGNGDALVSAGREVGRLLNVIADDRGHEALFVLNDDVAERLHAGTSVTFDNHLAIEINMSWPA